MILRQIIPLKHLTQYPERGIYGRRMLTLLHRKCKFDKTSLMHSVAKTIGFEYKSMLQKIYGDGLAELVLFGSYARGDFHEESDLDFAVVFQNHFIKPLKEIPRLSSLSSALSLKYGIMISSLPVTLEKKINSMQGVFQEIRKEGVLI